MLLQQTSIQTSAELLAQFDGLLPMGQLIRFEGVGG
jgi:hypothetical protein